MVRYLYAHVLAVNGYVGIVIREPGRNTPLQAVNGHCVRCRYRMAWIVITGEKRYDRLKPARTFNSRRGLLRSDAPQLLPP